MVTEDYVSFETAKLLKYRGADFTTDNVYTSIGRPWEVAMCKFNYAEYQVNGYVKRPSLAMAMKWLREVHHLYIQVMLDSWACGGHMGYYVVIQNTTSDFEMMLASALDIVFYGTYEEACEAAIKYCMENLI